MQGVWETVGGEIKYLAPGDRIEFWFPASVDATFADVSISARAVIVCEDADPNPPDPPEEDDEEVVDSGGDPVLPPSLDSYTWAIHVGNTTIDVVSDNDNRGGAISTTGSNVVLAVAVATTTDADFGATDYASVASVASTSGLTFTKKGEVSYLVSDGERREHLELWTAPVPGTLTNENITVTLDTHAGIAMGVVAIKDVVAQGDPSTPDPVSDTGGPFDTPTHPRINMACSGSSDFVLWLAGGNAIAKNGIWPANTVPEFVPIIAAIFTPGNGTVNLGMSYARVSGGFAATDIEPGSGFRGEGFCMAFPFQGT